MTTGLLDAVTQQFLVALQRDSHIIEKGGMHLFYYLAVFQLTLTALWQVLAGESLQRLVADMVKLAFLLGLFYGLIYLGSDWMPVIINGFVDIGQETSVQSLSPSSVISQGVSIAGSILSCFFDITVWKHPMVAFFGSVVCLSICIIYGLIAAELAIVLVKSYVLVAMSGLFFAFGSFEITRPMTKSYVQAIIGIGLQIMTLYFLLGVGQHIGEDWAAMTKHAAENHELMPMLVMLSAIIVYYMILKNVPSFIAGLSGIGGFQNVGAAAVGMSVNAAMQATRMAAPLKTPATALAEAGAIGTTALGKAIIQKLANSSPMPKAANDPIFAKPTPPKDPLSKITPTLEKSKDMMTKMNTATMPAPANDTSVAKSTLPPETPPPTTPTDRKK